MYSLKLSIGGEGTGNMEYVKVADDEATESITAASTGTMADKMTDAGVEKEVSVSNAKGITETTTKGLFCTTVYQYSKSLIMCSVKILMQFMSELLSIGTSGMSY